MAIARLKRFLDENGVRYVTIRHSLAHTAQEVAESAHVSGRELAKTVIVRIDGKLAMVVVPAPQFVKTESLKEELNAESVELAHEEEFINAFPNCEPGAMPPFGNLYGFEVYVSASLSKDEEISFNAGSHTELIQLAYGDFIRLARPVLLAHQ
jgi:Ala-tRNA(Pro) deacylase